MRRAVLAIVATITGLVLLLSFKTENVKSELPTVALPSVPLAPEPTPSQEPQAPGPEPTTAPAVLPSATPSVAGSSTARPTSSAVKSVTPSAPAPTTKAVAPTTARTSARPVKTTTPPKSNAPTVPTSGPRSVTGAAVGTQYGVVQIRITVDGGRFTSITVVRAPDRDDQDRDINERALPELGQQALARQSARLDVVSGATATSQGYIGSLQSALDAAGL